MNWQKNKSYGFEFAPSSLSIAGHLNAIDGNLCFAFFLQGVFIESKTAKINWVVQVEIKSGALTLQLAGEQPMCPQCSRHVQPQTAHASCQCLARSAGNFPKETCQADYSDRRLGKCGLPLDIFHRRVGWQRDTFLALLSLHYRLPKNLDPEIRNVSNEDTGWKRS